MIPSSLLRPEQLLLFGGGGRLPLIMQTEVAECGLACLAMIAGYYGYDTDILHLRRRFAVSTKGTSLKNIMDIAAQINFIPRALKGESTDLVNVQLPCIIH